MSTTLGTIVDDMKQSLRIAKNNMLSYFLANLGMAVLIGVLFAIIAIPFAVAALTVDPAFWVAFGQQLEAWAMNNPLLVGGIGTLVLIPIAALFLVVVGSVFGMSTEAVETGETKAESAFSYFRHRFLSFAGLGVVLTVIIILPSLVIWGAASIIVGGPITGIPASILSIVTFVWTYITVGLFVLSFPAVAKGKGVQEALKESYRFAIERFDRVYGLITAIIILAVVMFAPMIVWGILNAPMPPMPTTPPIMIDPVLAVIGAWTVVAGFLWLLLLLPMAVIAITKLYIEFTGGQVAQEPEPDIPMV
ncbi:hypothetical protein EU538_12195 [Candidatus Thorarchaeota archaeon]|nr:MAG: hypothetical protein EU538_12195 [Candidatus Thorarchaeota archaeon]